MEHILPLEINPPFKTFSIYANKQGIMLAQNKDAIFWIMSHYLDLEWDKIFTIRDSDISYFDYAPLQISYYNTYADLLINEPNKFIETIKEFICEGYYLWGYFNEIAIPSLLAYKQYDSYHDYFIYGFSDEELYSIGYSKVREYKPYRFTVDEYIDSLIKYRSNDLRIMLIKPTEDFEYKIDWDNIYLSINNFLKSTNIEAKSGSDLNLGLMAQEAYLSYLNNEDEVTPSVLIKNSRMLMEYKLMVHDILKIHPQYEKIKNMKEYQGLYQIYNLQHILSLKHMKTSNKNIIKRIRDNLSDAFERERIVLEKLIEIW